ncbi:type I-B CRISPR-associated protein Cas7/Csh2 [Desulforamulus ferrireducens]|uniref:Type I-B CRISPR-associated protein Cas7/Csh2 n=1 Tax=Desulforamulus ferrireducens TaxID=1833852 RepID=A0A1S6IUG1_9FIRM|nr:type I-B CRISPR-associated protein Cas7/Csh2 [Desulforamulus ferrireducens]AQS58403.1 type I-B CRISPR-associated protein Cas7/Csh2 [Desulforamulus ferrireducens]
MTFQQRREYLFIYSVKDANPNGDPLNANHPRYDEETGQVLVSDVRIKRTVRDQWVREGKNVFVDGEAKTSTKRIEELQNILKVKDGKAICGGCIDTRLFGVTYPVDKQSFSWTGPVQFKWGRSLHRVKPELIQGTAAFATKEGSEQRSFRNEYLVPFALIAVYGIANQNAASITGATELDLQDLKSALWDGTVNLITRSKVGHMPCLLIEIVYQAGFQGAIGALDEKIRLVKAGSQEDFSREEEFAIRSLRDCLLDVSPLARRLQALQEHIAVVNIRKDAELSITGELQQVLGDKINIEG